MEALIKTIITNGETVGLGVVSIFVIFMLMRQGAVKDESNRKIYAKMHEQTTDAVKVVAKSVDSLSSNVEKMAMQVEIMRNKDK